MPLEAKLATNSFQFHVHPHYKAKSKNVNSLCSYLQVSQITKSLELFDILPQQYRTKEVSKTLIMQLSFFGGVCKISWDMCCVISASISVGEPLVGVSQLQNIYVKLTKH